MTVTRGHGKKIDEMIDQAYRRGYHQAFHNQAIAKDDKWKSAEKTILKWRHKKHGGKISPAPGSGQGGPI